LSAWSEAARRARLQELGADDVRIELPYGHPVDEIVGRAAGEDATLIVMGSQGRGVLAAMVLGGVSFRVTRMAGAPVLVVPPIRSDQYYP